MIKLITYMDTGDELFDFSFKTDEFVFSIDDEKIFIETNKQRIYVGNYTSVLYSDKILNHKINIDSVSITKELIQSYYKDNKSILFVSTEKGVPLFLFTGEEIHHTSQDKSELFTIDGERIFTVKCNWLVIMKK